MPDLIGPLVPSTCYLYPEPSPGVKPLPDDIFTFQYWPQSIQVSYTPAYANQEIPGATHPLYQWTGGQGRTISFEAVFTSEVDPVSRGFSRAGGGLLTPSAPYTVDVAAALARIESYMLPSYDNGGNLNGVVSAPERLVLVVPGVGLSGGTRSQSFGGGTFDYVYVLLTAAPFTIESCFPSGAPRVATVALTFTEVIQRKSGAQTAIRYVGRKPFRDLGLRYNSGRTITTPVGEGF